MGDKITELTISFNKRNARYRGPTSSYSWNDSIEEISRDFNTIYSLWNNSLVPLLALIPDGTVDGSINAYEAGLDGRTLYTNSNATPSAASAYYNTGKSRPNTLYEQLQSLYQYIDNKVNIVQEQVAIGASATAASSVPIADSGDILSSDNVEDALQEIMNLVTRTGTSHGSLNNLSNDDHTQYLPRTGIRAMTGSLQMGGNSVVMTGSVVWLTGAGTPEGTVSAAVGSLYTRTNGGANTTLYVKESGAGSTGWIPK